MGLKEIFTKFCNFICCLLSCCVPAISEGKTVEEKIDIFHESVNDDLKKVDQLIDTVEPVVNFINPAAGLALRTFDKGLEKVIEIDEKILDNNK